MFLYLFTSVSFFSSLSSDCVSLCISPLSHSFLFLLLYSCSPSNVSPRPYFFSNLLISPHVFTYHFLTNSLHPARLSWLLLSSLSSWLIWSCSSLPALQTLKLSSSTPFPFFSSLFSPDTSHPIDYLSFTFLSSFSLTPPPSATHTHSVLTTWWRSIFYSKNNGKRGSRWVTVKWGQGDIRCYHGNIFFIRLFKEK